MVIPDSIFTCSSSGCATLARSRTSRCAAAAAAILSQSVVWGRKTGRPLVTHSSVRCMSGPAHSYQGRQQAKKATARRGRERR